MQEKPISEVAKDIKGDILEQKPDTTEAEKEAATAVGEVSKSIAAEVAKVKPTAVPVSIGRTTLKDDDNRAITRLKAQFAVLLDPNVSDTNHRLAHKRLVDVISANAKRNVMDTLLDFYLTNRNTPALHEMNALRSISGLDIPTKIKAESLYVTMRSISSGKRGRINLEIIREVFTNDDLVNWLNLVQSGNYTR